MGASGAVISVRSTIWPPDRSRPPRWPTVFYPRSRVTMSTYLPAQHALDACPPCRGHKRTGDSSPSRPADRGFENLCGFNFLSDTPWPARCPVETSRRPPCPNAVTRVHPHPALTSRSTSLQCLDNPAASWSGALPTQDQTAATDVFCSAVEFS